MSKIHDIVEVEVLPPYGLRVVFDDGEAREMDLADQLEGPVFEPLRDAAEFSRVKVDAETGTVAWPTGADLDPIVIYQGLPPLNASRVETAGRA
jgi:hypothetical protein